MQDRDWDVWQHTCNTGAGASDEWTLRLEASKLASGAVDTVSAVSGLRACVRRCQDMQVSSLCYFSAQLTFVSRDVKCLPTPARVTPTAS